MEVKLWNDKREREMFDNFAELFAIIKATERLEKAYVRDIISAQEYELECQKLIAHFKTLASTLKDTVPSIERFADTYKMECPAALNRLVVSGVPATVEHRATAAATASTSAAAVAECVQNFITSMDSLKLNMVAVDQVHPLLSDLYASLNKLTILPPDFEGKIKMKEWIARLSKMGAADELTEQQARQLHFDLESSYNSFMAALPNAGTWLSGQYLYIKSEFRSFFSVLYLVMNLVDWRKGIFYLVTAYTFLMLDPWISTNDGFVLIIEVLFVIVDEFSAFVFLPAVDCFLVWFEFLGLTSKGEIS